ncbi:MAG: glutathione S-transferase family protein [Alphaproteobacteria bacterium]|nr:glutathione S-transferase family protein [Alphaproteobacteria bacterium]MCB9928964.1 glutathione S-transferase family protein [Alphaproteobacteria bacterium]
MPRMSLYISPTSPFARKARIVAHEQGLSGQITEVPSQLRTAENEVLAHSATGKVPCLVVEDGPHQGLVLVESTAVSDYLNRLGNPSLLQPEGDPAYWQDKALDGFAHAFLDSIAWRTREGRRPENERSPGFVALETERQSRCFDALEAQADALEAREISLGRILVAVALDFYDRRIGEDWRTAHPRLAAWQARMVDRPSFRATDA